MWCGQFVLSAWRMETEPGEVGGGEEWNPGEEEVDVVMMSNLMGLPALTVSQCNGQFVVLH